MTWPSASDALEKPYEQAGAMVEWRGEHGVETVDLPHIMVVKRRPQRGRGLPNQASPRANLELSI